MKLTCHSQAVRIPAKLSYDRTDIEMKIKRVGDELYIRPARRSLSGLMNWGFLFRVR